jgi:response regulator RpfG family c-di-GMP phosphodiesterase
LNIDHDELLFQEEDDLETVQLRENNTWKILIVDDEEEVHQVTKFVLSDVEFEGKALSFLQAYSAEEAKQLIAKEEDIAVVLLDVVMEDEHSGLSVIQFVRQELNNPLMRIILRTGQPGQAPEKQVIMEYDINDYKEKTELTSQKLFSTLVVALRSYRDLHIIHTNKRGLEDIISSSTRLNQIHSKQTFALEAILQLAKILNLQNHFSNGAVYKLEDSKVTEMAVTGECVNSFVPEEVERAFARQKHVFSDQSCSLYLRSKDGQSYVMYLSCNRLFNEWDRSLMEIYAANVAASLENFQLNEEIESTQREIIFTLGEIAETRSKETGYHVKRVAEFSSLLAIKYGLSEEEAELIRLASPMHDVGKIGISDDILNKPGKLTEEEYGMMKSHAVVGYDMLKHSNRQIMKTAAIIALQHHEKYNGTGYPQGLKGEDIHLYGRITAIADVFDALASQRVYKPAWEMDRIVKLFREERGRHFDPVLTDLFLEHMDEFTMILDKYRDDKVF